jgi:hypothetical protein
MTRNHSFPASGSVFVVALMFLSVVCLQAANAQTTIHVPGDQATIQAAITVAQPGDTVLVAPGTYLENLDFQGKAITVTSSDGAAVTIVDGNGAGPVVSFKSGEGAGSVLSGLTVRNGVPANTFPFLDGAGVVILNSSPTITGNVITGNHGICGIGMGIKGGSAVIRDNTITGNTQAGGDGGCGGGGVEVEGDFSHPATTPLITGNTITNNSLLGGGFGGGIEVSFNASPTIQNNFISGNAVFNSGGGIHIQNESVTPVVIVQNIIVNNSVGGGGSGGGVYASSSDANIILTGNTIVGNTAFDGSSGIFADPFTPITISNNIVVAAIGQTGIVCNQFRSTFPTFSHNDVTSPGGGQSYSSNCAAAAQGNGNISLDPQLVNATAGDYHLQATSPAIDAGDNGAPNLLQHDYDGNPRIVDGNNDCTATVDMGAYELQASVQSSASPASLSFANQVLNTTSNAQQVIVSAAGNSCLKVSLAVTGDFAQSNTCGAGIPAGQSCVVSVTFTPITTGTRTGSLSLNGNAASVSLSGTGIAPATASVSPSSISFGNLVVGTESPAQTVTVSNTGGSTLHINSLLVTGNPDFFTLTNNCVGGPGVAPGGTCSAQVVFFPHSSGAGSATLTIGSDAINNPVSASISGTGVNPPLASVSPSALSFGNVVVGTESPAQTVTVSNTGGSTLHINSLLVTGDPDFFTLTNNCVGGSGVAPGGTCSAQVVFFPHSAGTGSATLTIGSDAINNPVSVSLSGAGLDFAVSVSPSSLSVRSGHQAQTAITVSAVGGSFGSAVGLGCSGLPSGAVCGFSPASVTPGAANASSTLTINTQSGGTKTPRGTYHITVNGSSNGVLHSSVITLTVTQN